MHCKSLLALIFVSQPLSQSATIEVTAGGSVGEPTYQFSDASGSKVATFTANVTNGKITAAGVGSEGGVIEATNLQTPSADLNGLAVSLAAAQATIASLNATIASLEQAKLVYTTDGSLGTQIATNHQLIASNFRTTAAAALGPSDYLGHFKSSSGSAAIGIDGKSSWATIRFMHDGSHTWQILNPHDDNKLKIWDNSAGGVEISSGTTSWSSLSDMRLKRDWRQFDDALAKIGNLTHVGTYERTASESTKRLVGLAAQEVRTVLPEAVEEDADGFFTLRYQDVFVLGLKAIQELSAKHEAQAQSLAATNAKLEATNARLEATNAKLEVANHKLEARLAALEARLP